MKQTILICLLAVSFLAMNAQVKLPAPSPTQTIKQDFGLGNIQLTYSRPGTKGRKVFGELVPFDQIWRTGANSATIIRFSDAVEINGRKLDTGAYALYTVPGAENWEIILNKGVTNWGTVGYKESDDVIRFKVAPKKLRSTVETFTMEFTDVKSESCNLELLWDNTYVDVPIATNIRDKVQSQLDTALVSGTKPYFLAAQFYNEYENNFPKAFENINKAVDQNPNAYWLWLYKAKIQKGMGDKAGALVSSKKSLEIATNEKNDDYIKLNQDFIKKLNK